MYTIRDFKSKQVVKPHNMVFTGKDAPWEVLMDLETIKSKIDLDYFMVTPPCLSKYLPLMPIQQNSRFVSLRETATPLLHSKRIMNDRNFSLYFKIEGKNPTGSFKDRGSAVDISVAREMKARGIVLASTGNMAASCSCYAAAAKMPCFVFVPEGVSVSKLAQVIAFGGHIVQVKGNYNEAATLAESVAAEMDFYLAGDYAFRVEGQKTAAFEMIDQLLFQVPDMIIVPIGCGTNIAAYHKGFSEYLALGLIHKMPKIIGVEATGAAAVVNSFIKKSHTIEAVENMHTLATAIAVAKPLDGIKALEAIYQTDGLAIAVSDQEMLKAQYLLSTEEGLFVEAASATTLAALQKLDAMMDLSNQKIVCVLTGDGLKDPNVILKSATKPPTIYPEISAFTKLYKNNFFKQRTMLFVENTEMIFNHEPSIDDIKQKLVTIFNAEFDQVHLEKIQSMIQGFLRKGKQITAADLQDIIQDAQESIKSFKNQNLVINDFTVTTGKDKIPEANVTVTIDQKTYSAKSEGVGPVAALINALCAACEGKIEFKLTDYKVDIRSVGVDAVVNVELKLRQGNHVSVGQATSPDIIQASIEAFEEAYNGFGGQ